MNMSIYQKRKNDVCSVGAQQSIFTTTRITVYSSILTNTLRRENILMASSTSVSLRSNSSFLARIRCVSVRIGIEFNCANNSFSAVTNQTKVKDEDTLASHQKWITPLFLINTTSRLLQIISGPQSKLIYFILTGFKLLQRLPSLCIWHKFVTFR